MVDTELLTLKVEKGIEYFQSRYNLSLREMTDILLNIGVSCYLKDVTTRQMNGNRIPYLADWHLRQGLKYYRQDLKNNGVH